MMLSYCESCITKNRIFTDSFMRKSVLHVLHVCNKRKAGTKVRLTWLSNEMKLKNPQNNKWTDFDLKMELILKMLSSHFQ